MSQLLDRLKEVAGNSEVLSPVPPPRLVVANGAKTGGDIKTAPLSIPAQDSKSVRPAPASAATASNEAPSHNASGRIWGVYRKYFERDTDTHYYLDHLMQNAGTRELLIKLFKLYVLREGLLYLLSLSSCFCGAHVLPTIAGPMCKGLVCCVQPISNACSAPLPPLRPLLPHPPHHLCPRRLQHLPPPPLLARLLRLS
jgi:hypothetical protein